jgi:hypothetical protein
LVTLDGTAARVVADSTGAFAIVPLPPGRYTLVASDTTFAAFVKARTTTTTIDVASGAVAPLLLRVDAPDTTRIRALARAVAANVRTIMGTVTDTAHRPIPGAEVRIRGGASVVTSADGGFHFADAPLDAVLLEIRRVGFAPAIVGVPTGRDTTLALGLGPLAQELDSVKVSERELKPEHLRAFEDRMHGRDRGARGGYFITAADIEQRNPTLVTSMFTSIPGIHVLRVAGTRNFSVFGMSRGMAGPLTKASVNGEDRYCDATVFLDGIRVMSGGDVVSFNSRSSQTAYARGVPIDQLVLPSNIAGIEVYPSPNTAPTEYQVVNNGCAIVLIWTKSG